jgi:hypothetical protein
MKVVKSRGGEAGHIARIRRQEIKTKFSSGNLKKRYHLRDVSIEGKIMLKCIPKKQASGF